MIITANSAYVSCACVPEYSTLVMIVSLGINVRTCARGVHVCSVCGVCVWYVCVCVCVCVNSLTYVLYTCHTQGMNLHMLTLSVD